MAVSAEKYSWLRGKIGNAASDGYQVDRQVAEKL
jgi:hypothetical protein